MILSTNKFRTKISQINTIGKLTIPWSCLHVATKGISATSHPNTRKIATDTTKKLQLLNQI